MTDSAKRIDLPTVAGIAAVAYVLTTLCHEGLGHGGACLAVHGKPEAWGAYYFNCSEDGLPAMAGRIVAAAGSTVNLILAAVLGLLIGADLKRPGRHGSWTVFLWLLFAVNAFTWAGYYLFSGVAGIGDWGPDGVLKGIANPWLWRAVMAVGGMAIYVWLTRIAMRWLGRIGGDFEAARAISWTAYVTGGILAILIGLRNPEGWWIVIFSSMASSLGGTSGLAWGVRWARNPENPVEFDLPRNWLWIGAGLVAAALYAWYFGPTLKL